MIPVPNRSVSGGGLRAWGLGEGLKSRGHDVIYSIPRKIAEAKNLSGELLDYAYQPEHLWKIIRKVVPDVILFEQWGLVTYLEKTNIPVVIDLHGSLIIENYFRKHRGLHNNVAAKIKTLVKADYIICPSERQKNYFIPWLMLSGFPVDEESIAVVPVSFSPDLPERDLSSELTFIFSGGLWPWINPFPALDIVAEQVKSHRNGCLKVFSQKPDIKTVLPKDAFGTGHMSNIDRLKNIDRVDIRQFIPHEALLKEYRKASVAVDIYQWNRERDLAFSTRTIEFLWAGLPVIHAEYSEISDYIRKYEAGWCLDPNDVESISKTVSEIYSDRDKVREYSENAQELVKAHFTWDRTVGPLNNFVLDPFQKRRKQTFFDLVSLEFDRLEDESLLQIEGMRKGLIEKDKEIEEIRASHEREMKRKDEEKANLNRELNKLQDQLNEETEKHKIEKEELRLKLETENQKWVEKVEAQEEKLTSLCEIEIQLRNRLHESDEKVKYVQGVLKSIQNRFPYRLYKVVSFRFRRILMQYPRLLWLFVVNFLTNAYMSRWCRKKGRRIFPAQ